MLMIFFLLTKCYLCVNDVRFFFAHLSIIRVNLILLIFHAEQRSHLYSCICVCVCVCVVSLFVEMGGDESLDIKIIRIKAL